MPAHPNPAKQAAIASGSKVYRTGKPCARGHYSERATSNGMCVTGRDNHNIRNRHLQIEWAKRNPDRIRELRRQGMRRWAERNPEIARGRRSSINAQRRAAQIQRTPKWADVEATTRFYFARPIGMVVDHIVPLQGRTVCGLHVVDNLQYLSMLENCIKSNTFDDWGDV